MRLSSFYEGCEQTMQESYLAHYGILGMKWGVRRYQPYSVRGRKSGEGGKEIGEAKQKVKKIAKIAGETAVIGGASYAVGNQLSKLTPEQRSKLGDAAFTRSIKAGKDKPNISPTEQIVKETGNIVRVAKKAKNVHNRPVKAMSNSELKERIERLQLEKSFEQLNAEDVARGRITAEDILSVIGSVAQIGGTIYVLKKIAT